MKRLLNILVAALFAVAMVACSNSDDFGGGGGNSNNEDGKSIKILAIGNSFSVDAMEYLYGILADMGYEEIVLGNLYIGGCSLQTHATNLNNNKKEYTYYKNTTGRWESAKSQSPFTALQDDNWDYVTLQQASPSSGIPETFDPYLYVIISHVMEHCPDSDILWHMTWAYQSDSTHSGFANYSSNQMTMYNAIVNTVKSQVLSKPEIVKVIPSGTAVQNMRTSYIGDNLTRDGYHLSYDNGRLLAAMTYAKAITGRDLSSVNYLPSQYSYTPTLVAAMKEAVDNAIDTPYEVTKSTYTTNPDKVETNALEDIIKANGYNAADYNKIDIDWTKYAYYQSNASDSNYGPSDLKDAAYYNASTANRFIATQIFTKSDIPNGSLIVVKSNLQYRPEGWVTLDTQNSSTNRPGNVTTTLVVVNDSWWGNWNYRGFNITPNPTATFTDETAEEAMSGFGIYTPKN